MQRRYAVIALLASIVAAVATDAQSIRREDYEVALVPLAVNSTPGAFGTTWRTTFSIYHDSDLPPSVIGFNTGDDPSGLITRHTYSPPLYSSGPNDLPGVLLYVSRARAADTHFDLHFNNIGSPAAPTALPIIREGALLRGRAILLRVPGGLGQRRMLRIYAPLTEAPVVAHVKASEEFLGNEIGQMDFTLLTPADVQVIGGVPFRLRPTAAQISLDQAFPSIATSQSATIVVEIPGIDAPFWAFVTTTSNTTQAVTVTLPN